MKNLLPIATFVAGTATLTFFYGAASVQYKLFPYPIWQGAVKALDALSKEETIDRSPDEVYIYQRPFPQGGGVTQSSTDAYEGYTFFTTYTGDQCTNVLVDMDGTIVHEWYISFSDVWGDRAPFLQRQLGDEFTCWQGTHLMPNGDLIASFTGNGTPYCGGAVRLDRESNIVWSLPHCSHHNVHLGDDGLLYLPGMSYDEEPAFRIQAPGEGFPGRVHNGNRFYWQPPFLNESILVVSPEDGRLVEEIPLLEAITESGYRGLMTVNWQEAIGGGYTFDPLHSNDVEYVSEAWAQHYPGIEAGDLLVSIRNISTLAIVDRQTRVVKWAVNGQFIRQHDPDLLPNGNILLFDNWGDAEEAGRSRAIELDPRTQQIVWDYSGTPDNPLYAEFRGSQQVLPNGNILITESTAGRLLEVTRDGETVWEYINQLDNSKGDAAVGTVIQARRYSPDELTFLN